MKIIVSDSKIAYIQDFACEKKSIAHRYFSDTLLDEIMAWKEERNRLIHALLKQNLTAEAVSEIAHTGERLTKEIRTRTTNFNRAVVKITQQKEKRNE